MNKLLGISLLLSVAATTTVSAQYTLTAGENVLEIKGIVASYYQYQMLKVGQTSYKKNNFYIKDAQLDLVGRHGKNIEFELQVDFNDLAINATAGAGGLGGGAAADPFAPGVKAAYFIYKGLPIQIKLGYDKLPYSMGSMDDRYNNSFWSHGYLCDGNFFARRDLGITLSKSLWNKRINMYGGVYSGLGEMVIGNADNDASGNPEYVGRVDVSYPSKMDYTEVDQIGVPTPIFRLGANVRYMNKTQNGTSTIPAGSEGTYGVRIVDGENLKYGFDANVMYKSISLQFESDFNDLRPSKATDPIFEGTSSNINHNVVHAGGTQLQLNYFWKHISSVFSVRYENINYNDLIVGKEEWLTIGYAYQLNGFKNCIKFNYDHPLTEDTQQDPIKYNARFRLGWQLTF